MRQATSNATIKEDSGRISEQIDGRRIGSPDSNTTWNGKTWANEKEDGRENANERHDESLWVVEE